MSLWSASACQPALGAAAAATAAAVDSISVETLPPVPAFASPQLHPSPNSLTCIWRCIYVPQIRAPPRWPPTSLALLLSSPWSGPGPRHGVSFKVHCTVAEYCLSYSSIVNHLHFGNLMVWLTLENNVTVVWKGKRVGEENKFTFNFHMISSLFDLYSVDMGRMLLWFVRILFMLQLYSHLIFTLFLFCLTCIQLTWGKCYCGLENKDSNGGEEYWYSTFIWFLLCLTCFLVDMGK